MELEKRSLDELTQTQTKKKNWKLKKTLKYTSIIVYSKHKPRLFIFGLFNDAIGSSV
jgi:hypothetical protein